MGKEHIFKNKESTGNATGEQLPSHQMTGDREQPDPVMVKATGQGIYSQS